MHASFAVYVVSALHYMLHVEAISIVDTPLPRQEQLDHRSIVSFNQKDRFGLNKVERITPDATNDQNEEKILNVGEKIEDKKSQHNAVDFDTKNMINVRTGLFSKSESDARNALETIRSQLFHQIRMDRNWQSGNSMAITNLKALELLLLNLDAMERVNHTLNPMERNLLENTMEIIYDLRNFPGYSDGERVWLYRQMDQFFSSSNSSFLKQEYLQIVRRRVVNMNHDIALYKEIGVTGSALTPEFRIDERLIIRRNPPQDIVDFISLFNERAEEKDISNLHKTLDRWCQTFEAPLSIKQPPQVNFLRLELIGVGALSLKRKENLDEEWHYPFFTSLIRLSKTCWNPEHRIMAEELVRSSQALEPALTHQFVKEYPIILNETLERDLKSAGVKSLFDRILCNGVEKDLRQTASDFKAIFERMQEIHLNEIKSSLQDQNTKLEQSSLAFMKNFRIPQAFQTPGEKLVDGIPTDRIPSNLAPYAKNSKEIVQKEVEDYIKLTQNLENYFLNNPFASRASRMVAEELIFGAGLLATKLIRLKFPNVTYETFYRISLATMKKTAKENIPYTVQNHQFMILSSLAKRYSSLLEENASQLMSKFKHLIS